MDGGRRCCRGPVGLVNRGGDSKARDGSTADRNRVGEKEKRCLEHLACNNQPPGTRGWRLVIISGSLGGRLGYWGEGTRNQEPAGLLLHLWG